MAYVRALFFLFLLSSCTGGGDIKEYYYQNVQEENEQDEFTARYFKIYYANHHDFSQYDTKDRLIYCILYNMIFEGGLSKDLNDIGNYYGGRFCGTKYGLSAAFAMNFISCDSLKNINRIDAVRILYEYLYTDYLENKTFSFLMYYTTSSFFIGKENTELYMLDFVGWTKERNRLVVDSIMRHASLSSELLGNYIFNRLWQRVVNMNNSIYSVGWKRRLIETRKHTISVSRHGCSDIAFHKVHQD